MREGHDDARYFTVCTRSIHGYVPCMNTVGLEILLCVRALCVHVSVRVKVIDAARHIKQGIVTW